MRGLRLLLAATAASVTGDGMLVSATPLAAAAVSRDPADVGFVAAAATAAWLIVGVPAGALVDRWELRRTMIISDAVRFVVLGALGLSLLTSRATVGSLAGSVFLVGVATCFFTPAGVAMLRDVVGADRAALTSANGRLFSIDAVGRSLAGPPLGAWSFGISQALPFIADAVSFAVSALLLWFLPRPPTKGPRADTPRADTPRAAPGGLAMGDGVRFLVRDRELRVLALCAWSFNFGYFVVFAPFVLYAQDRLGVGVEGFGLLLACGAAGGVVGGLLSGRILRARPALSVYAAVLLTHAGAWLAVLLAPPDGAAEITGLSLAAIGAAATIGTVTGQAARQVATPAGLLGRVAAVHRVASAGGGTLGALAGGVIAASLGGTAPFLAAVAFLVPCAMLVGRSAART